MFVYIPYQSSPQVTRLWACLFLYHFFGIHIRTRCTNLITYTSLLFSFEFVPQRFIYLSLCNPGSEAEDSPTILRERMPGKWCERRIKDDQKTALLQPELIFFEKRIHLQRPAMVDLIRITDKWLTIIIIPSERQAFA